MYQNETLGRVKLGKVSTGVKGEVTNKVGQPPRFSPEEMKNMVEEYIEYSEQNKDIMPSKYKFYAKYDVYRGIMHKYINKEEYRDSIKKLYEYIEDRISEKLIDKREFSPGQIFYLKNVFGWTDKQEIKTEIKIEVPEKKDLF